MDDAYALIPIAVAVLALISLSRLLLVRSSTEQKLKCFPLVGLEEEGLTPAESYRLRGWEVLDKGRRLHKGPFRVMTGSGSKVR